MVGTGFKKDPGKEDQGRRQGVAIKEKTCLEEPGDAFDKIQRQPNTRKAHSLIAACEEAPLQERMVQALFDAYFIQARDLTDDAVLEQIAAEIGLPEQLINDALHSPESISRIQRADIQAREMGVQGVPFFVFNGRLAVSGAQASDTLLQAMQEACDSQ